MRRMFLPILLPLLHSFRESRGSMDIANYLLFRLLRSLKQCHQCLQRILLAPTTAEPVKEPVPAKGAEESTSFWGSLFGKPKTARKPPATPEEIYVALDEWRRNMKNMGEAP